MNEINCKDNRDAYNIGHGDMWPEFRLRIFQNVRQRSLVDYCLWLIVIIVIGYIPRDDGARRIYG